MTKSNTAGFTLVELMIVIVIIGILAAIAYPSYQESISKARRIDGQAFLMGITNAQERFFTQNNRYTTNLTDLGYSADGAGNFTSNEGFYHASAAICTDALLTTCINITGTAQGAQINDGDLTLNSRGQKTPLAQW